MSIIPLHLQRRFEQRWAAQFGSLVIAARTKERRIEGSPVNIARRAAKAKEKPAGTGRSGSRVAGLAYP
jgi:hypothetical protein